MNIITTILIVLLFCTIPAGVIWLCRRFPVLDNIGPIMILYGIGIIIGNLPFMPEQMAVVQDILPNVAIPLAIPMMLYGCTFSKREAALQIKVVLSGIVSVAIAVVTGYLIFGHNVHEGAEIGGIITGMYTGGTLNAAALQAIFRINSETYVLINSYDIIISFLYFVMLFSFGIKMFRKLYGEKDKSISESDKTEIEQQIALSKQNPYRELFTHSGAVQSAKIFGVTITVVAISALVALLCPEGWFMVCFILMITTLGVALSFVKQVATLNHSYDIGMYFIYIFSITIASMADFSKLDLAGGAYQLAFMTFAVFVSLTLHALFRKVIKVDADSMVISSVAFINSPPFVPMVSAAMRNKKALVTGLAAGIVGYAVGNYLGVIMVRVLHLL